MKGIVALRSAGITWEHHRGVSFIVFPVDAPWADDEHGSYLVVHPEKPVGRGTSDDVAALTESDVPPRPLTVSEQFFQAFYAGDDARAGELANAANDPQLLSSALASAVEAGDIDLVRRCLALGADPNVVERQRKASALQLVRRGIKSASGFSAMMKKGLGAKLFATLPENTFEGMGQLTNHYDEMLRLMEAATKQ